VDVVDMVDLVAAAALEVRVAEAGTVAGKLSFSSLARQFTQPTNQL